MRWAWIDNLAGTKRPRWNRGRHDKKIGMFIPFGKRILSIRWDWHA